MESSAFSDLNPLTDHSICITVLCYGCIADKSLTSKLVINAHENVKRHSFISFNDWKNIQIEQVDNSVSDITVFMINNQKECLPHLKTFVPSTMRKERLKNIVFHNEESNVSCTYDDMVKNDFQFICNEDNIKLTLNSTIQYILEYNIVSVLDDIVKYIKVFSDKLQANDELPQSKKQPPEEDVKVLKKTMKTLQFEIFGLLRQTGIDKIRTNVPTFPELSSDLQMAILRIPGIIGCGTSLGQLVMHMSRTIHPKEQSVSIKIEVEKLLKEHKFSGDHVIEYIDEKRELSFKQGNKTVANLIKKDENGRTVQEIGTLGCFVNVTNTLFAITCAHCVMDCEREIEIINTESKKIIGIASPSHYVYRKDHVDIAAIEIDKKDYRYCDTCLINEQGLKCKNWTFQKGYPRDSTKVYKRGSITGFRQGRITMTNYLANDSTQMPVSERVPCIVIENCNATLANRNYSGPFSAKGDSGSVVWYDNMGDTGDSVTTVFGILFSGWGENENDSTFEFACCCPIDRSIQELEKEEELAKTFGKNFKIQPDLSVIRARQFSSSKTFANQNRCCNLNRVTNVSRHRAKLQANKLRDD